MSTNDDQEMEQRLMQFYISRLTPILEGGAEWNLSPECAYLFGFQVRDFLRRTIPLTDQMQICNIGIGAGEWDDFLGYWSVNHGRVTSVDIDRDICEVFAYRQQRERHPNPSEVVREDLFCTTLPPASFDLVTIIGSTAQETGDPARALAASMALVREGGCFLCMLRASHLPETWAHGHTLTGQFQLRHEELFDYYPTLAHRALTLERGRTI